MIIGGNNKNGFNQPSEGNAFNSSNSMESNIGRNPMIESNRSQQHTDVMSKSEMADKSFAMIQERYQNGLISLEEFTKQCNKLNKLRDK